MTSAVLSLVYMSILQVDTSCAKPLGHAAAFASTTEGCSGAAYVRAAATFCTRESLHAWPLKKGAWKG